jgi:prepilin-type processing-associated H-X9-DG protein
MQRVLENGVGFSYSMNWEEFNGNWDGGDLILPMTQTGEIYDASHLILLWEIQGIDAAKSFNQVPPIYSKTGSEELKEETLAYLPPYGSCLFAHYPSRGASNWLFCDGSVRMVPVKETLVPQQMWFNPNPNRFPVGLREYSNRANSIYNDLPPPWK